VNSVVLRVDAKDLAIPRQGHLKPSPQIGPASSKSGDFRE